MGFDIKEGYYYLHTNGTIISKPMTVINGTTEFEYFDSPFVVKYWHIKTNGDYAKMTYELSKLRMNP